MEPKTLEQGTSEEIEKEIEDLFGGAESPDEGDDLDDDDGDDQEDEASELEE